MLDDEIIRKVRRIEITTRKLVHEGFSGEYRSVFKGRGMEFDEVRQYSPGDDVRSIDWNVTARTGEPHVKRYVEERELTVMLAVDVSRSADFGTRSRFKRELAVELTAVLSLAATTNNDNVGLLLFTDRVELLVPPRKGRKHVLRMLRELLAFEPEGLGTDIRLALDTVYALLKRRSIVFSCRTFSPTRRRTVSPYWLRIGGTTWWLSTWATRWSASSTTSASSLSRTRRPASCAGSTPEARSGGGDSVSVSPSWIGKRETYSRQPGLTASA